MAGHFTTWYKRLNDNAVMQYWKITDKVLQTSREVLILRGKGFVILLRESCLPGRRWIQRSSSIQQVWHSGWRRHHVHWRGAWTTVKQNKSLWRVPCMPYWKVFRSRNEQHVLCTGTEQSTTLSKCSSSVYAHGLNISRHDTWDWTIPRPYSYEPTIICAACI